MAAYKLTPVSSLTEKLRKWEYDYQTATYFLMFEKKQKGTPFKLTPGTSPLTTDDHATPKRNLLKDLDQGASNSSPKKSLADSPRGLHNSLEGGLDNAELLKIGTPPKKEDLERTAKNRASER